MASVAPSFDEVRSTERVSFKKQDQSVDQEQLKKTMIKNFICSCVAVNPDLANKDFNTPLQNEQSVMTSPASIASSTPIETNLSTPNGSVGASIN